MGKFQALLNLRLKQKSAEKGNLATLAKRSNNGELSSFSGVFRVNELQEKEVEKIANILEDFKETDDQEVDNDLALLSTITAEVRAITNQAVILHGERIKKAQNLLKSYKDGAFSAWLIAAYSNRQTPYNFLQYYEFYISMPHHLHPKIDEMPRQAVYSLASRDGEHEKKEEIVENYFSEPKTQILQIIRKTFPLPEKDKRAINYSSQVLSNLKRVKLIMKEKNFQPTFYQKKELKELLEQLLVLVE